MAKAIIVVMDSLGVGEAPDADVYGDIGSNTLGNMSRAVGGLKIPNLEKLGIGYLTNVLGVSDSVPTIGSYGKMQEVSNGKDTTTGHWEMMGIVTEEALPTFPNAFPNSLIEEFENLIDSKTIGNEVASGTEIIERLGEIHEKTAYPIIYTSADSVFQIAAHEEIIPLERLYEICEIARKMLDGPYRVGRVIARPFIGTKGEYVRTSNRHDYSIIPPSNTLLDDLKNSGKQVISIGKINDIFASRGITSSFPTKNNMDGIDTIKKVYPELKDGLIFANLVDFDSQFGHRNDPEGYAKALEELDSRIPELIDLIDSETILFFVADHGNDPTTISTDHSREFVPLLVYGKKIKSSNNIGIVKCFGSLGASLADYFSVYFSGVGKSFLNNILIK